MVFVSAKERMTHQDKLRYPSASGDIPAGAFSADIKFDSSITEPTEIHALLDASLAYAWYPKGVDVDVSAKDLLAEVQPQTYIDIVGNTISIMVLNEAFDG